MNTSLETQVRELAYSIWKSAGEGYGQAVDCWLMAEQMVAETAMVTARIARAMVDAAGAAVGTPPSQLSAEYGKYIRELAYCMSSTADQQYGHAMDFWLASEKHIAAMIVAATRTAGSPAEKQRAVTQMLEAFSPSGYLERIRKTAYAMWEAAGRQYGNSLDYWLMAEQHVLQSIIAPSVGELPVRRTAEIAPPPVPKAESKAVKAKPKVPPKKTATAATAPERRAAKPSATGAKRKAATAKSPGKSPAPRKPGKK